MDETRKRVREIAAAARAHLEEEVELGEQAISVARERVRKGATGAGRATGNRQARGATADRSDGEGQAQRGGPAPGSADRRARLGELEREAAACEACELHRERTRTVFHGGDSDARLAFVGEGPGYEEDQQGEPFVGQAGQLLDRMIAAMGLDRGRVYICNVVKCRPPDNRTPLPGEAEACRRVLEAQLQLVSPEVIVALGRCAAENLGVAPPSGRWRGAWGQWHGIAVMPTYHPAYLLRTPSAKRQVWDDLQKVMKKLGMDSGR